MACICSMSYALVAVPSNQHQSTKMDKYMFRRKILHLDGGRVLATEFRTTGLVPFVDLFTHDTSQPEIPRLRIYSSEFQNLKTSIQHFINYLQRAQIRGYVGLERMPESVLQASDPLVRGQDGSFLIDCSRSHKWLMVRYSHNAPSANRPSTVMGKEHYFPIQLAFKVEDFPKMNNLMKTITIFFNEESRKRSLLEKRLTTRAEDVVEIHHPRGYKIHIKLFSDVEASAELDTNYVEIEADGGCEVETDSAC